MNEAITKKKYRSQGSYTERMRLKKIAKVNAMIKIGKDIRKFSAYSCQPKTYYDLKKILKTRIDNEGLDCDLNDIDTSLIEGMDWLFAGSSFNGNKAALRAPIIIS